jgi:uncharacterized metal-binding protein
MPSGRTHDRITLWGLPLIVGAALAITRSDRLTLILSGAFLFSGLMFGPDLDIRSRQFSRWGWLRWLWLPYQRNIRHRSWLSHGFLTGTLVRVLYLGVWMLLALGVLLIGVAIARQPQEQGPWFPLWQNLLEAAVKAGVASIQTYPADYGALLVGLELGAVSHILSDRIVSAYKRLLKVLIRRR